MTEEQWQRTLGVNLTGVFFTLQIAARHMVEGGRRGRLIAMYLEENFKNLILQKPLFYQWPTGLRFEIGQGGAVTEVDNTYINKAHNRAVELFDNCFSEDDSIMFVYQFLSDGKRINQDNNFVLSHITNLDRFEMVQENIGDLYTDDFSHDDWMRVTIKRMNRHNMNYSRILLGILNADLQRTPRAKGECYFINTTKNLILNLYDDRGMDIIARRARTLRSLYDDYNDWLLDHDRDKMDLLFAND